MDKRQPQPTGHGFFYDWLERCWVPRPPTHALSPEEQAQRSRRSQLLRDLR